MSEALKLRGVVLRTVDYGDSDRVVSLFTEERGKVSAFARGARASKRRFGGALEPFTLLHAELKEKRGADLLFLESVSVERGYGQIRGELARIACAAYACELARELIRDAEPHADLFELLLHYLGRLDAGPAQPTALRVFELGALRAAGLMPMIEACARCGKSTPLPEPDAARVSFDPAHGGFVCGDCSPYVSASALLAGAGTAMALLTLQAGFERADAAPLGAAEGAEAKRLLSRFIEHHLGHQLKSRAFLDEMGQALR